MSLIRAFTIPMRGALCALAMLALSISPAKATQYEYSYQGNAFTMTTTNYFSEPGDPSGGRSFQLVSIDAKVITNRLLTGDVNLNDVLSFSLSLNLPPWFEQRTIGYPAPPPVECPGCPNGPNITASLSMGDFNFLNQPGRWDLSLRTSTFFPTGREGWLMLSTSGQRDMLDGGYEAYVGESGGLINSPGIWTVTAVVPEPASVLLSLAGVAALGWRARRHWRAGATLQ